MGLFSFFRKKKPAESGKPLVAVVLAAGSSERMGGADKQFLPIDGVPVLARTLLAFEAAPSVERVVVITRSERVIAVQDLCREYGIRKVTEIVKGGATRLESGLIGADAAGDCGYISVHDGARPLVTPELIERVYAAAQAHSAAIPGVPVTDTVKRVEKKLTAKGMPPRDELVAVQTPQIFDADLLRGALRKAAASGGEFTDDASAVEAMGMSVYVAEGDAKNIKITRPADIYIAEALLFAERDGAEAGV